MLTKNVFFGIDGTLHMEQLKRITVDPAVMGGKACIRGLRVTVATVIGLVAVGRSREEILKDYPYLESEDIDQALDYMEEIRKRCGLPTSLPVGRLSCLEAELENILNECAESGQTLVVEMPDQRLLAIQSLDPNEDDSLMDELLASNPEFQELVAKSKSGDRKTFQPGDNGGK